MTINNISFDKLTNVKGKEIIFNAGTSNYVAINSVKIGETYYDTIFEAIENIKIGETIVLEKDIDLGDNNLVIDIENIIIDLNDKSITGSGSNGTIQVVSGSAVIKGNGSINATLGPDNYSMAVWVTGGNLIIEGGTFRNTTDNSERGTDLIYASVNGKVYITGGTFEAATPQWTLNCKDKDYKSGSANIFVSGGSFKGFDPSNNKVEGENTNFVIDGYKSIENNGYYEITKI